MTRKPVNSMGVNFFFINALVYISFAFYTPFLSAYFSKAGINAVQIGIILTIGPILSIFVQPLWAILSDRTGRRKDVLSLVALGSALAMLTYYIGNTFLTFFLATFLVSTFTTALVPLSDAIIIRSATKHRLDFSKIRLGGTVGYAIIVIIAGAIVKQNPQIQFALGAVGFLVFFLVVRGKLTDEGKEDKNATTGLPEDAKSSPTGKKRVKVLNLLSIFTSKQIIFVLAFALISQMGLSFHYSFLGVYLTNMNLSEGTIGLINSISAMSEIPVLFLINRLMRRMSSMKILLISCLLLSFRFLLITSGGLPIIFLAQAMHGITYMTIYFSCATFISQNVKPEKQSQGQSILSITQGGIGSILGNIIGGELVDSIGLKASYRTMSLILFLVVLAIAFLQMIYTRKTRHGEIKQ